MYLAYDERKFGIIVDKHVKGGVKRNKMRRRIREIYRKEKFNLKKGKIVFRLHKEALDAKFSELLLEFEKLKGILNE